MRLNEVVAFAPLVVIAILMGVYPSVFLDPIAPSVNNLLARSPPQKAAQAGSASVASR